mmetsp:Transcript_24121/g.59009  ORF Transcript_24121/g.59009 Transcript_24121/m.59009 type:complete len:591 (+) Transcript_24121:744-2516(+)
MGKRIANSIIAEKEEMAGLHAGSSQPPPSNLKQQQEHDFEHPSADDALPPPLIGRTVSSSASTKPPAPPVLNRQQRNQHYRPSQPGAVAMVGPHMIQQQQVNHHLQAAQDDDRTIQVGGGGGIGAEDDNDNEKAVNSPLVDAVLVSDDNNLNDDVEAPTSPAQQSVEATTAVPMAMDESDLPPQWGLRDRRVQCIICVLIAIIAGLAAGLSLLFLQNTNKDIPAAAMATITTASPTSAPTMTAPVPTASPTSRMTWLQELLSKYVNNNDATSPWEDTLSTQYQALDWMANQDTWRPIGNTLLGDAEQLIVERYAMAVLYFSLNGPNWNSPDETFVNLNRPVCGWQVEDCDSIGECEIYGVLCNGPFVTGLILTEVEGYGTIPSEVGLLSSLTSFLVENQTLFGSLPGELFLLPELESVSIEDSGLTGTLPSEILQAPSLHWLSLRNNLMEGSIENAANPNIEELDLGNNFFTGEIPASFGDLTSAYHLGLEDNNLSGPLPDTLSNMRQLYYLAVHNNVGLTGTVPSTYSELSLTNLFLDGTGLTEVESVFCGSGLLDYEEFYADCGGSRPKVLCRCCTHCCTDETGCFLN